MTQFHLIDIWSQFHHRKVILSYYTESGTCSNESGETKHSVHGVETSWKLKARHTACTHLAWENALQTSHTAGRRAGRSYPLCQQLAAVQWTR